MHFLKKHILVFILFVLAGYLNINAQELPDGNKTLIKIEDAIQAGDVSKLSGYLNSKTYFSYTPDLTGYFSYSQIYNLLRDYFSAYNPIKFKFTSKSAKNNFPFGWGEYVYLKNGIRGSHKIFISLDKSGGNFYISQMSIN